MNIFHEIHVRRLWLTAASALLWLLSLGLWFVLWFKNPYSTENFQSLITYPGVFMAILSLVGIGVSIKANPLSMLVVSVVSFLPIGSYFLGTPGIFSIIGWSNLACLVLSILIIYASKRNNDTNLNAANNNRVNPDD